MSIQIGFERASNLSFMEIELLQNPLSNTAKVRVKLQGRDGGKILQIVMQRFEYKHLFLDDMAERKGFEPLIRSPVYTRSRRAPSTTRPPLQRRCNITVKVASSSGKFKINQKKCFLNLPEKLHT